MNENSNNHDGDTIQSIILKDEEVQVFNLEDLDYLEDQVEEGLQEEMEDVLDKEKVKISTENNKQVKKKNKKKRDKTNKTDKIKKSKNKKNKEKQPKRNIAVILGILVLLAGALYASWEFYFSFEEYNPFDYIEIIENGADTQAYLEIEKDELVLDPHESLIRDHVDFMIPKNENLSVGDVREITVYLDDETKKLFKQEKIRLNPTTKDYTVGNVSDLEEIDVMDALEIEYEVEGNKVRVSKIIARVSDLDLRDMMVFETTDKLLELNDIYTVTLKESKALDAYLLEHGYVIEETEKEFTVESFDYVPQSVEDLGNIDALKEDSLKTIELDLNSEEVLYENFKVQQICFTGNPENEENARDKNFGHEYARGSLMFLVEFNRIDDGEVYADAIGVTNIIMKGEKINPEQILEMNPLYIETNADMIKRDMVLNNFDCSKN